MIKKNKSKKTGDFSATISLARNRKGLSIVIGYILLITISIVMSVIVYQWLKTYVPKEAVKCDEGTSIFIKEISCITEKLNVTIKNNGKFSIDGYFIHVSNNPDTEQLAVIDISKSITEGGYIFGNYIRFTPPESAEENALAPDEVKISSFDVTGHGTLYKIEIIPVRIQEVENKKRIVTCGDAKIEEILSCNPI